MPQTSVMVRKPTLVRALGVAAEGVALAGLVAPGATSAGFGIPASPENRMLVRFLSSRTAAIAAWLLAAQTEDEVNRGLTFAGVSDLGDALVMLVASRRLGRALALRAVPTAAAFGVACLALRAMKD